MSDQLTDQNSSNISKIVISITILFGISLLFYVAWMSQFFDISIPKLIVQYKNCLFYPNMNRFIIGEIGEINVLTLLYWFLIFETVILGIYYAVFVYSPNKKQDMTFSQIVPLTLIAGLMVFSIVQQFHRYDFYKQERNIFQGKTVSEKNQTRFGGLYQFPQLIGKSLKNRHRGEMITDYNLSTSPYMFHHRALSYYFYPKVSLRLKNDAPIDTLFLYAKKNPLEHIPDDYEILLATDDKSFVLAIDKQALK